MPNPLFFRRFLLKGAKKTYTLTIQPSAVAGIDTYLSRGAVDTNYGTGVTMAIRNIATTSARVTLIKFDLSGLPVGAVIISRTLYLYLGIAQSGGSVDATIHRILDANSAWTEAGATWNYAVASSIRWAGDAGGDGGADAGCSVSGIDYSAVQMGSFSVTDGDLVGKEYVISLGAEEFASMLVSNNGLIILTASVYAGNTSFASSDHSTSGYHPKLVIDYVL